MLFEGTLTVQEDRVLHFSQLHICEKHRCYVGKLSGNNEN